MTYVRLLVCGGRDYADRDTLFGTLDTFVCQGHHIKVLIEGEAPGADTLARQWAEDHTPPIKVDPYPADWSAYGKAAGPIRNQEMLTEGKPTYAFAFYDRPRHLSKGTADMVRRLKKAGIPVQEVGP